MSEAIKILNPTVEDKFLDEAIKEAISYDYIKPDHYKLWDDMEPFELHRGLLKRDEYIGYLKGNILKYRLRMGNKPNEPLERDRAKMETFQEELSKFLKQ